MPSHDEEISEGSAADPRPEVSVYSVQGEQKNTLPHLAINTTSGNLQALLDTGSSHSLIRRGDHRGSIHRFQQPLQLKTAARRAPVAIHHSQVIEYRIVFFQYIAKEAPSGIPRQILKPEEIEHGFSATHKHALVELLGEFASVFDEKARPTTTPSTCHRIRFKAPQSFRILPYRYSDHKKAVIYDQLELMLRDGIIEPSTSEFSSPIVVVKKKDRQPRFFVDYCKLNAQTVDKASALPRIDKTLRDLGQAKVFSTLNLRPGYRQIPIADESRRYTAFTTPDGSLYQFCVMPFGLKGAPGTFQRLMTQENHLQKNQNPTPLIRVISDDKPTIDHLLTQGITIFSRIYDCEVSHPPPPTPRLGHGPNDCTNKPICPKCPESHHPSKCTVSTAKCPFCQGSHPAWSLLELHTDSSPFVNLGSSTVAVFLDIERAFDKVWHDGLILKLLSLQIKPRFCQVQNALSNPIPIRSGVPQSSILSPLLYIVYCRDFPISDHPRTKTRLFADDTAIWSSHKSPSVAAKRIQTQLQRIQQWTDQHLSRQTLPHKIPIHYHVVHSSRRALSQPIQLLLNNQQIPHLKTIKYLGVTFSHACSLAPDIHETLKKVRNRLNLLYLIRGRLHGCNPQTFLHTYNSFIRPVIEYRAPIYASIPLNQLLQIASIERRILRKIFRLDPRYPCHLIHATTKTTPITERLIKLQKSYVSRTLNGPNQIAIQTLHTSFKYPAANRLLNRIPIIPKQKYCHPPTALLQFSYDSLPPILQQLIDETPLSLRQPPKQLSFHPDQITRTRTIAPKTHHPLTLFGRVKFNVLACSQQHADTEGFSPVKTGKKRPAPSRSPQSIETQNKFLSLSEEEESEDSEAPLDAEPPLQGEKRKKKKKKSSSSSKQSFTQAAPSWSAIAAGHPSGSPKGPILAAPQVSTPALLQGSAPTAPQGSTPAAPQGSAPTAPQDSAPTAPKASRIPPIFLRDAGKWHLVSQKANFTKARSVSDQIRIQPTTVADFRLFTRFMEAERIPFHTFTLPEEKTTRVVLRGIPVQVSTDEVFADLKRQGFNPISTHRMHTGKRQLPLVLLQAPLDQANESGR
ncbi:hypothetical protein TcasGA2_TC031880 [Tribolium castaneum]|nr:hypothetical protein TcasGA2_TC031880 [Tribolium castaneum]